MECVTKPSLSRTSRAANASANPSFRAKTIRKMGFVSKQDVGVTLLPIAPSASFVLECIDRLL